MTLFNYIALVSAVILTILVLMQTRGASLGAGFGGTSEIHTTRRGVDKSVHQLTIIVAFVFVASIVFSLMVG